jgi:Protein of unknown function (DUF2937)
MAMLRGLLDRLILLAAVVAAACIPSFVAQYRQRLGGRLEQVQADLMPFQAIANHSFGGDLSALIRHHLASRDGSFHQEGQALQQLVDAAARLRAAVQGLNTDLVHQCLYLLRHPDMQLLRGTWSIYQPGFTLTLQGAEFALVVGVLVWLLFLGLWHGTAGTWRLVRRRRGGARRSASTDRLTA